MNDEKNKTADFAAGFDSGHFCGFFRMSQGGGYGGGDRRSDADRGRTEGCGGKSAQPGQTVEFLRSWHKRMAGADSGHQCV